MPISVPAISIIVPTFNEPRLTLEQSFASLSEQTFQNFECLVIDDSTDPKLAATCQELCNCDSRFRYIHPINRLGLGGSLNFGISNAQAEFIARFDADDICVRDRLELQVSYMTAHPEVGVLGGCLEIIDGCGTFIGFRRYPTNHRAIDRQFQLTTAIAHPTAMIRRSVFETCGGYDEHFPMGEDLELWLRLLRRGVRFANLDAVLVKYRQADAGRPRQHWKYNVVARIKHVSLPALPLRVMGIVALSVWTWLPHRAQARISRLLLLRRTMVT